MLNRIEEKLNREKASPLGNYDLYSVFIPLINLNENWHILFEVRAEHLSTQPGEVSFPGGSVETGESRREAALRETREELRVKEEKLEMLGEMDFLVTPYNLLIYSYVGVIKVNSLAKINYHPGEVGDIFAVPLEFFRATSPRKYQIKVESSPGEEFPYNLIPGGREYDWRQGSYPVYFYQYKDYVIWGFTARLLQAFIKLLSE